MSSINKHSKSVSNMIDKIDSNKKDTKNLIEKRYRTCYMSDDLDFEKNIESSSPSSVNAEKSRNLVTKLISRFEKKNDKSNDRTKNVNKEFLRRSFMRIPLPRITTYYHDTCDNSSNLRESTLDENIKRLSNIKNVQLNKNVKTFENDIEIVNDSDIIAKSSSSNFRLVDNDPKEKWTTSDKRWSETTNDEKINQKKSIKEVLSSLISWKKHNNKNKSRRSRSCDKSEKHHEILPSISIIPRAHSLQTVVINNTKDKNNTNLNRNATIRPIYGIKRNQTTPKKYLESFQSIKINPRKEDSGYGSGILSVEESIENLVKPSAIREMSKKLTFIPEQHQDQETWNHKDNIDRYRQVLSHCKRDRNSYQRKSFVHDELKEVVKKRFNDSSNESIIYTEPINHELKRNYSSLYINKINVNTEYENTQNISSPLQ
ncbi:uncharacterized protein LOC124431293 [Vespa crabro]|uniref:uncharacterized protein LOC124431293 n=1 Tax=Vespa crabro TaxID=7445 RepID=UPI001F00F2A2|nr:uncharacterized protein LOC124431293 [Vespa crabro]